jgi:hypothetical protein
MTEKKPKKVFYYGRRPMPLKPEQLAKLKPVLADEVDFIAVELALEQLDEKFYVATSFCERIAIHLSSDLGVPRQDADLLVALRLDQPDLKALKKSMRSLEHYKSKLTQVRAHTKRMAEQERAKAIREQERLSPLYKTGEGKYGLMGKDFGMQYFFEEKTQYLHLIEEMLKTHTDQYLQISVDSYPEGAMGWLQWHHSFGEFWIKVQRLHLMEHFDFSEPGLKSVRQLATYLFTWNFRRYIDGAIIRKHARCVPRMYRYLHTATRLDRNPREEIDLEYEEVDFEDEEPGDNIGNR